MEFWHLTFASTTRHTLFPTEAQLRAALSKVLSITKAELLLYDLVDDHLHVVIWCSEARRMVLQRALLLALRPLASTELAAAHPKRIEGRSHLLWLVRYLLLQVEKHGLAAHPALWSGSCFQDLVGARCVLPLSARLARALPRLRLSMVQEIVGIPLHPIEPISAARLRALGPVRLVSAAGSALLVGPELRGKSSAVMCAKRAVAQLGWAANIPTRELAWAVETDASSIRRWKDSPCEPRHLRAVGVRLALEQLVEALPRAERKTG
jgi:hypothetical protein